MDPLSDPDLHALLAGDLDAEALRARLDGLHGADARVDAYRDVFAALDTPPDGFAPGFADRVMAGVAEREAVRPARFPARLVVAVLAVGLGWVALRTEALASLFDRVFPGGAPDAFTTGAVPHVVLLLVLLASIEALEAVRRRGAQPS